MALKMHLFVLFRPARRKLICRGKNEFQKKGGGGRKKIIKMHNIYP